MKAIGIDIGTTSVCGVVIDTRSGKVINSVTKDSNAFSDGCADWEKIQCVNKIIAIATEILDGFLDEDVSVIGVTGQMHGIVYIDENGVAVSPLYTWQDGRGNLYYKDGKTYAEFLGSASGYGKVTDFYNRKNGIRPETAVGYCTIHDYFVMRLCKRGKPIIHDTDFASFGSGADFSGAEVVSGFEIAGEYKNIPVSVAIGDNQASVFSTLTNENDILVNIGTGSQISVISDKIVQAENIETRPYFDGKYLIVGAALCGGRAYSMLKNFYREILGYAGEFSDERVYETMNLMLEKTEKNLLVDTRFAGTRVDKSVTGGIFGISTENFTPGALTKGFLQGMIKELSDMYTLMGVSRCGLVGSGNGIRKNPALIKCAEDAFSAKMKIPTHLEEAAVGAALFGMVSAGICKSAKEAQGFIAYERD